MAAKADRRGCLLQLYDNAKQLRYGHLMIMTDQDHDGSHIKGLIMNFFHHFFPSLLKMPGFLLEFITPIVKVQISPMESCLQLDRKFNTKEALYAHCKHYGDWKPHLSDQTRPERPFAFINSEGWTLPSCVIML